MNNVHSTFIPILNSIFPLANPRKKTLRERLITEWEQLHDSRKSAAPEYQYPIIMNMARIKTILRERYNYTVNY